MASPSTDRRYGLSSSTAIKAPVRVAASTNITLSGEQSIDGVACVSADRVLLPAQTDPTQNGIWVVDSGAWSRDLDFNDSRDVRKGTIGVIMEGSYQDQFWMVTTSGTIRPGTTAIAFAVGVPPTSILELSTGAGLSGFSHAVTYPAGTLGLKGRQLVQVKDAPINAACDGATDDYATIKAYLDTVVGDPILVFPANAVCMTSQPLPFHTNRGYVCLDGMATIKAHPSSLSNVIGVHSGAAATTGFIMRNIIVDGNRTGCAFNTQGGGGFPDDAYQNALRLNQVSFSLFENVIAQNSVMNGFSVYNDSSDNVFISVQAKDIGKSPNPGGGAFSFNGIFLEFGVNRNRFYSPYVKNTRQNGIWETTNGADNYDNHFYFPYVEAAGSDGIRYDCDVGTNTTHRPKVVSPTILYCQGAGSVALRLRASAGATVEDALITDPVIHGCTNGIVSQGAGTITRPRIVHPSVRLCTNSGIEIGGASVDAQVVGGQSLSNGTDYLNNGTRTICYGLVQNNSGEFRISGKAVVNTDPHMEISATNGVTGKYSLNQSGVVNWDISNLATSGTFSIGSGALGTVFAITQAGAFSFGLAGGAIGFLGASPIARPAVIGSRASGAALVSLLVALDALGLITDSTSA